MAKNSSINVETLIHMLNVLSHELEVTFCEVQLGDGTHIVVNGNASCQAAVL